MSEPQKDLLAKARALLIEMPRRRLMPLSDCEIELLRQLVDEVERLREEWNTRFNTLCGLCGKRYLGPRDEHLHGFGRCDKKAGHDNSY